MDEERTVRQRGFQVLCAATHTPARLTTIRSRRPVRRGSNYAAGEEVGVPGMLRRAALEARVDLTEAGQVRTSGYGLCVADREGFQMAVARLFRQKFMAEGWVFIDV